MVRTASELVGELRTAITDARVLEALVEVPRELFVPPKLREYAYENAALPIAAGQTISQPLVVGRMCELLELTGDERVLDVGTGSGYHAAVLSRLAAHVYSVERHRRLSEGARRALARAGIANVELLVGDGTRGHPDEAPYDAINVGAGGRRVPGALERQLGPGGRMVIPLGVEQQRLVVLRRVGATIRREQHEPVRFVPLVGRGGPVS